MALTVPLPLNVREEVEPTVITAPELLTPVRIDENRGDPPLPPVEGPQKVPSHVRTWPVDAPPFVI